MLTGGKGFQDGRLLPDVCFGSRMELFIAFGGISFSEHAWRQVQGKVAANFVDTGEQSLKKIARPVRV